MGCAHPNSSHNKRSQQVQTDFIPSSSALSSSKKPVSKMKYPPNLVTTICFSGGLDTTIPDKKFYDDQLSEHSTEPPLVEELCIKDIEEIELGRKAPISACSSRSSFSFMSPLHTEQHGNNPPQFNFESQEYFLLPGDSDSPRLLSLSPFTKATVFANKKSFQINYDELPIGQPSDFKVEEFVLDPYTVDNTMIQKEIPLQDRLRSCSWSVRARAYEELAMTFEQSWDDEVFEKYSKTVIENITDFNPSAQRKALETFKVYLSESDCTHLNPRIALKVLIKRAFKKSFEDNCFEIVYFLFEKCDKKELTDSLINLIGSKNPKVQVTALKVLTDLFSKYGAENFQDHEILMSAVAKQGLAANFTTRDHALKFFEEAYNQLGKKTLPYVLKLRTPQLRILDKNIFEKQGAHILPQKSDRVQRSLKNLRPVLKFMSSDLMKPLRRLRSDKKPWRKLPRIKEEAHEEEKVEKLEVPVPKEVPQGEESLTEKTIVTKNIKRKSCQMIGGSQNMLEQMKRVRRSDVR